MLRTAVDDGVVDFGLFSTCAATPASLHGRSPSSLLFSSLQLRCGGVAAELELISTALSTAPLPRSDTSNGQAAASLLGR